MKEACARILVIGILLLGVGLWVYPSLTPQDGTSVSQLQRTPPTLADTAWAFSKVALSALPGLLVVALSVALISAPFLLFFHHRSKIRIREIEATQMIPRGLERLSFNAGSRNLTLRTYDDVRTPLLQDGLTSALNLASVNLADLLQTFQPSTDRIFIGTSAHGPVYRSLPQLMHVGLLGSSNSGKSTAQLSMAVQMVMLDQARLTILDPQAKTFSRLRNSPKLLLPFPMDDRDCVDNLQALQDILAEREAQIKKVGAFDWYEYNHESDGDLYPIFNFVDELPVLAGIPDAVDALIDLARRGRAYGLYLVLAGQGFRKEDIGNTAIRQQITTKFVLRCGEEAQVRPIGGIPPEMVEMAVQFDKPGMAIFRPDDEPAQIIRLPYIAPRDAERLLGVQDTSSVLSSSDAANHEPADLFLHPGHVGERTSSPGSDGSVASEAIVAIIRRMDEQGYSQNKVLEVVFGAKRGDNKRYHEAREVYRQITGK
jgi:hypothetical protein